ncbi:MAG: glucosamine-6-phosphate deaminase [Verrucomicrobiota bacterium]|jgi:glucosamine-6-phosphate deaminase
MEIIIQTDAAAAALMAWVIGKELRANPRLVLGLAAGSTMEPVYRHLVRMHQEEGLDFSRCRTFNLDEYAGLAPTHPNSFSTYMRLHLFDKVNLRPENAHLPNGAADNLEAECARYERLIQGSGGIDLQVLGIGRTGHLGFNEPPSPLDSRTRVQALAPLTREQNAPLFAPPGQVPSLAITIGIGTILDSRCCLLLATGARKAQIVAKAFAGPVTSMVPASALQLHPDCAVILDEPAAVQLPGAEDYRRAFEQEPRWQPFRQWRARALAPRPADKK